MFCTVWPFSNFKIVFLKMEQAYLHLALLEVLTPVACYIHFAPEETLNPCHILVRETTFVAEWISILNIAYTVLSENLKITLDHWEILLSWVLLKLTFSGKYRTIREKSNSIWQLYCEGNNFGRQSTSTLKTIKYQNMRYFSELHVFIVDV